jgi:hypothetical protein
MRRVPLLAAVAVLAPSLAWADSLAPRTGAAPRLSAGLAFPLDDHFSVTAGGDWVALGLGWRLHSPDGTVSIGLDAGLAQAGEADYRPSGTVSMLVVLHFN